MEHYPGHVILGVAAAAATLAIISLTINQLVQRKLRFSLFLFAAYLLFNLIVWQLPGIFRRSKATSARSSGSSSPPPSSTSSSTC